MADLEELSLNVTNTRARLEQLAEIRSNAYRVWQKADLRYVEAWDNHDKALEALAQEALKGLSGTSVPQGHESG